MRICSLLPSGTEILFAMGLGEQVVGVSDLCDFPPECAAKPVVSRSKVDAAALSSDQVERQMQRLLAAGESPFELDSELLLKLSPDVVLTQDLCYFCDVSADQVEHSINSLDSLVDRPRLVVLQPKTLDDVFYSILEVGQACGAPKKARSLVDRLRDRVEFISQTTRTAQRRPMVFSLEGINPLAVGGHWIPDILNLAGGSQELYLPGGPAARPQWREICDWAPEKLFIDLCSSDLSRGLREVPWLAAQDGWASLPAVRSGEVYLIDHVYFSRPGPRTVQGLEILAQLTHPELFSGLVPPGSVVKLDADMANQYPAEQIARCFKPHPAAGGQPS